MKYLTTNKIKTYCKSIGFNLDSFLVFDKKGSHFRELMIQKEDRSSASGFSTKFIYFSKDTGSFYDRDNYLKRFCKSGDF